jgi:preprotein translocase subunit SecY
MLPIPEQIKHTILYIMSVEAILVSIFIWMGKVVQGFDVLVRLGVSSAGLVIAVYTILHLREKIKSTKLENKRQQLEIRQLEKELDGNKG